MADGLDKYLEQFKPNKKRAKGDESVARVLDDEFAKLGYGDTARLSILGDVGRENNWNRNVIFGGHDDPKNKARNRGIISWQGDRRKRLDEHLKKEGVLGRGDDDELRGMARFMDKELQSPEFAPIRNKLLNARSTYDASEALRKYIKYVPDGPYNSHDPEFRVKNNATWAKEAKRIGLGQSGLDKYLDQFLGGEADAKTFPTASPSAIGKGEVNAFEPPGEVVGDDEVIRVETSVPRLTKKAVLPKTAPQNYDSSVTSVTPPTVPIQAAPQTNGLSPDEVAAIEDAKKQNSLFAEEDADQRRSQAVTSGNQYDALVETIEVDPNKNPHEQAVEALQRIAPKYGIDVNRVLQSHPNIEISRQGNGSRIDLTYGDLRNFGVDADALLSQRRAEQRVEQNQGLREVFPSISEADAEKELTARLNDPDYAAQQIAAQKLSDPTNLIAPLFLYRSIFDDTSETPSDEWVRQEKERLVGQKGQYQSFNEALRAEKYYQGSDSLEKALRFTNQTSRSFVKNLVSGTFKTALLVDSLNEQANPLNRLLPEKAKVSLRNAANYADAAVRMMQGDYTLNNFQSSNTPLDQTTLFKSIQEFDKAVGDDSVLKGRFLGAGADAFGSMLAFVALGAVAPSMGLSRLGAGLRLGSRAVAASEVTGSQATAALLKQIAKGVRGMDASTGLAGAAMSAGSGYEEGKGAGLTEDQAKLYGVFQGLLGTTEMLGAGAELASILKSPTLRKQLTHGLLEIGRGAIRESKQEFAQEVFQTTSGKVVLEYLKDTDPSILKKLTNALNRLPSQLSQTIANEGLIALLTGGVMGGATSTIKNASMQGASATDATVAEGLTPTSKKADPLDAYLDQITKDEKNTSLSQSDASLDAEPLVQAEPAPGTDAVQVKDSPPVTGESGIATNYAANKESQTPAESTAQSNAAAAKVRPEIEVKGLGLSEQKAAPKIVDGDNSVRVRRTSGLDGREQKIEAATIEQLAKNTNSLIAEYRKRHGFQTVNADLAKEVFEEYRDNPLENNESVKAAASALARTIFDRQVAKLPQDAHIIFTAGGQASGKTSAVAKFPDADLIYDSVMSDVKGNREMIDKVIATGNKPTIVYVYRPLENASRAMVRRMNETGRPVPIKNIAAGHFNSQQAFINDTDSYARSKGVDVQYYETIENERPREISFEQFKEKAYTDLAAAERIAADTVNDELESNEYAETAKRVLNKGRDLQSLDGTGQTAGDRESVASENTSAAAAEDKGRPSRLKTAKPQKFQSLSQFVRQMGGIKSTKYDRGEHRRISNKETGSSGLINKNSEYNAERMAQLAWQYGFLREEWPDAADINGNDFMDFVEEDVTGGRKLYSRLDDNDRFDDKTYQAQEDEYFEKKERDEKARKDYARQQDEMLTKQADLLNDADALKVLANVAKEGQYKVERSPILGYEARNESTTKYFDILKDRGIDPDYHADAILDAYRETQSSDAAAKGDTDAVEPQRDNGEVAKSQTKDQLKSVLSADENVEFSLESLYNSEGEIDHERVQNAVEQIFSGEYRIERLDREAEAGRLAGSRLLVGSSLIVGGETRADAKGSSQKRRNREEDLLESYAKSQDAWIDDIDAFKREMGAVGRGAEAEAFEDPTDPDFVIKVVPIPHIFGADSSILRFFDDKIALHNTLPDTAPYQLVGFARDLNTTGGSTFQAILKQPYVRGEETTSLEDGLIKQMKDSGFLLDSSETRFVGNGLEVVDIENHNVIKGVDGRYYIFDPIVSYLDDKSYKAFSITSGEDAEQGNLPGIGPAGDETNFVDSVYTADGGINYEQVRDVAGRIESGELEIERLDPEGERGRVAGGKRTLEATVLLGADEHRRQTTSQRSGPNVESRGDAQARQERLLESYAKREGIWYEWKKFFRNAKVIGRGGEAFVFRQDDHSVVKTVDYRHINKGLTPQRFLDDRIALYNHIFPGTKYELIGLTKDDKGKFRFLVKQPFIDVRGVSEADVEAYMAGKGFEKSGREAYSSSLYSVFDVHQNNAAKDREGNIYVIDAVPKPNYEYQPFTITAAKANEAETPGLKSIIEDRPNAFYSRVEKVIDEKMPAKASKEQITALLAKNSVKELDPEFQMVKVWLDDQTGSVTRDDVLDFVRANQVGVEEIVKGQKEIPPFSNEKFNDYVDQLAAKYGVELDVGNNLEALRTLQNRVTDEEFHQWNRLEDATVGIEDNTSFPTQVLPGASTNYREEFVTAPAPKLDTSGWKVETSENIVGGKLDGGRRVEVVDANGNVIERMNTMSDDQQVIAIAAKHHLSNDLKLTWKDGHTAYNDVKNPIVRVRYNDRRTTDGDKMLFGEEIQQPGSGQFEKMPKVYQKYGELIAIKKLLYRAAAGGYDYLGLTTGKQQVARYENDLRQNVDKINWKRTGENTVDITAWKDNQSVMNVTMNVEGETHVKDHTATLDRIVGKGIANNIKDAKVGDYGTAEGDGLTIGGDALASRYDKSLVGQIDKYLKPWGVKSETKEVNTSQDLMEYLEDDAPTEKVYGWKITPELAQSLLGEGQPLFTKLTDETNESERMTVEEMRDMPYKPIEDIVRDAEFELVGQKVKMNAAAGELVRRTHEEIRIADAAKSGKKLRKSDYENLFGGEFLEPKALKENIETLRAKATEAERFGYEPEFVAKLNNAADMLEKAAEGGQGSAVAYVLDSALPHELFHQVDYQNAIDKSLLNRHSDDYKKQLDAHAVKNILWDKHYSKYNEYKRFRKQANLDATLRAEVPAFLLESSDDKLASMGITPEMKASYLETWFEGYGVKNGIESLDAFAKEDLNVKEYVDAASTAIGQRTQDVGGTRGQGETVDSGQESKQSREGPQDGRGDQESSQGQRSQLATDGVRLTAETQLGRRIEKREAEKEMGLPDNQRLRSLPLTLRRAGIDAIDDAYEVFKDDMAVEMATDLLEKHGIEGSIELLRNIPAKAIDAEHGILSFMVIKALQNHARSIESVDPGTARKHFELSLKVAREHAIAATQIGRFTRVPSIIGPSVETLKFAIQGIIEAREGGDRWYHKTMTPEAWERIEGMGQELESALATIEALRRENRNKQAQIRRLKDEKEGKRRRRTASGTANRQKLVDLVKKNKKRVSAVEDAKARLLEKFAAKSSVANPAALKSVLPEDGLIEADLNDFSEVGAMMLMEGIAGETEYLPSHFKAEMIAEFGSAIEPYFDQIYTASYNKRADWLEEVRYEQTKERITNREAARREDENLELDDQEIAGILGEDKAAAKRRRFIEKYHQIASKGKRATPRNLAAYRAIIADLTKTDENDNAALGAMIFAEGLGTADAHKRMVALGITEAKDQRDVLRRGDAVWQKAKVEFNRQQNEIANEILAAEGEVKKIDELQWEARQQLKAAQQTVADEMRRIKNGEGWYALSQFVNVMNASRTLMASFDMSGALRQGGFFTYAKPEMQKKAFGAMFRSIGEKGFGNAIMEIENHSNFNLARRSGLDFAAAGNADEGSLQGEELFRGDKTLRSIPLLGGLIDKGIVGWSERTYTAFLDTQRMIMFDVFAKELMSRGMTFQSHPAQFKQIAKFVNIGTGRGSMPSNRMAKLIMELPLFAPRYTLSRLQLLNMTLNPIAYANMPAGTRRIVAKQAGRFYGTTMAVLAIMAALGFKVGYDPDDDDFAKFTVGSTKFDLFAGTLQPAKLIIKIAHSAIRTKGGFDNRLPGEFGNDVLQATGRFARGKLSPSWSLGVDWALDADYVGEKFNWKKALVSRVTPLVFNEIHQSYTLDGVTGVARSVPLSFFGVGVSTYKDRPERPETEAEKLAAKAVASHLKSQGKTAEEKRKQELVSDIRSRGRQGQDIAAELDAAVDRGDITTNQQRDILASRTKKYLLDKAEGLSLQEENPEFMRVWELATDAERRDLQAIFNSKMKELEVAGKLKPDFRRKLESLGGRIVGDAPMPEAVKNEFDRLDISTPDVGESLTLKKGTKTHLSPERYDRYRREALTRIYARADELIATPEYRDASKEDQREMLDRLIRKQRAREQKKTKGEMRAEQ